MWIIIQYQFVGIPNFITLIFIVFLLPWWWCNIYLRWWWGPSHWRSTHWGDSHQIFSDHIQTQPDYRGLVCGGQALHHRHQEDRHVEHRLQAVLVTREREVSMYRDSQGNLLPGFCGNQEDKSENKKLTHLYFFSQLHRTVIKQVGWFWNISSLNLG